MDDLSMYTDPPAPVPRAPMPELEPDPSQGPTKEQIEDRYFARMSDVQAQEYGEEYAIQHVPSGKFYPFCKHKARNPECRVVPRALFERQVEREREEGERLKEAAFERAVEAEMARQKAKTDIEQEAARRLAAAKQGGRKPKKDAAPAAPTGGAAEQVAGQLSALGA